MTEVFHITYLNKTQQASLRGLLFQQLKSFVTSTSYNIAMQKTLGFKADEIDAKDLSLKIGEAVWEQFKTYNCIIRRLISFGELIEQKGRNKLFQWLPDEMQMILQSRDLFV